MSTQRDGRGRQEAAFQAEIAGWWRDWCAYLAARLELLGGHDEDDVLFEQRGQASERERAKAAMSAIDPSRRAIFDSYAAEQRAVVQGELEAERRSADARAPIVDPDEVERVTLERLLDEAEGRAAEHDGFGRVPTDQYIYRVDVTALRALPDAAAYAVRGAVGAGEARRRLLIVGGMLAGLALFCIFWFGGGDGGLPAAAVPPALVNGTPVAVWRAQQLTLSGDGEWKGNIGESGAAWPAGAGAWQRAGVAPIRLCAPASALRGADEAAIASQAALGDAPLRSFAIDERADDGYDLSIEACDDPTLRRYGHFRAAAAPETLAIGGAGKLGERAVTLVAISSDGGAATGQPLRRVSVELRIAGDDAALESDLVQAAPTLLFASGERSEAPTIRRDGVSTWLDFLAAPQSAAIDGVLALRGDGRTLRWRFAVPPQPDEAAQFAAQIDVIAAEIFADASGMPTLRLTLHNRGATAISGAGDAIALLEGDARRPLLCQIDAPLAAGERRAVACALPALAARTTLAVGLARFSIEP